MLTYTQNLMHAHAHMHTHMHTHTHTHACTHMHTHKHTHTHKYTHTHTCTHTHMHTQHTHTYIDTANLIHNYSIDSCVWYSFLIAILLHKLYMIATGLYKYGYIAMYLVSTTGHYIVNHISAWSSTGSRWCCLYQTSTHWITFKLYISVNACTWISAKQQK